MGRLLIFFAPILLFPQQTLSQTFCSNINKIIDAAGSRYEPIRDSFDFNKDEYVGKVTLGELTKCRTSGIPGLIEYECESDELPDSASIANGKYEALVQEVKTCLGKRGTLERRKEMLAWFTVVDTDDQIAVSARRIALKKSHPYYTVSVEFTTLDPGARR